MRTLVEYSWPGNVRELKNAFAYAFVTCTKEPIEPAHLPPNLTRSSVSVPPVVPTDDHRKQALIQALAHAKGNKLLAAKMLGVLRVTVWNRVHRYGLHRD